MQSGRMNHFSDPFWTQTGARRSFWLCTAGDRRRNPALGLQMSHEHRGADGTPGVFF